MNRYKNNLILNENTVLGIKPKYATNSLCTSIFNDCKSGLIQTEQYIFNEGDRLDYLSQKYYGNGIDWWVIAAASGIGWWLQINPGTIITIPTDIKQVKRLYNL
jgi:nucleoid-associated protein YgaU